MDVKKFVPLALVIALAFSINGCATTGTQETVAFASPDQKVLYDLMAERCSALGSNHIARLQKIYSKDSTELTWIDKELIPTLSKWPATYRIVNLKSASIIGIDAAARFTINVNNGYKSNTDTVDVVYIKENSEWKIDYVVTAER